MKESILILLIILSFSCNLEAEEMTNNGFEFDGGVTYNNYLYKKYDIGQGGAELDNDYFIREDLHSGTGYYLEAVYWLNSEFALGLGVQKNKMEAEWETESSHYYESTLDTYYTSLKYRLEDNVKLYFDLNYNNYNEYYSIADFSTDIKKGAGLGVMIGTEINYSIYQNFDLRLQTGYYLADIEIEERYSSYQGKIIDVDDEELEISGLGLKLGLEYKF